MGKRFACQPAIKSAQGLQSSVQPQEGEDEEVSGVGSNRSCVCGVHQHQVRGRRGPRDILDKGKKEKSVCDGPELGGWLSPWLVEAW